MKPVLAVAILVCSVSMHGQVQAPPSGAAPHADEKKASASTEVPASIIGTWKSAPFELELVSDLHTSVYGPGARSVRTVDLVIRQSGEGTFTVTNLVRNRRGATVPGTRSVEELTFTVGAEEEAPGPRTRHSTDVTKAERRYLDEPVSSFPLDGASLDVYPPTEAKGALST